MDKFESRNMTKEIRILADTPASKKLIPKYEEALEYLGDVPDVPEDTTVLDKKAIQALLEEKDLEKARDCEDKIELRRKKALKSKIRARLKIAQESQED